MEIEEKKLVLNSASPVRSSPSLNNNSLTRKAITQLLLIPLAVTVAGFGGTLLILWLVPELRMHAMETLSWLLLGLSALILFLFGAVLRHNRVPLADIGFVRPTWRLLHVLWQVPVMLISIIAVQFMFASIIGISAPGKRGIDIVFEVSVFGAASAIIATSLLVPIWEEITFRGVIYGAVQRRFGMGFAVISSGLLFAVAHGVPILLPYFVTLGISLSLIYAFHKNLWAPIIAHASLNTLVAVVALTSI